MLEKQVACKLLIFAKQKTVDRIINIPNFNRPNWLRLVYTHFRSCDHSLDKTSFDFSNKVRAMLSCAMNAKSSIKLKLPKSMFT